MPKNKSYPVRELLGRLEEAYGRSRIIPRFDPMEELVSCILSQHTSDANSFPTFTKLRSSYVDWADMVSGGQERLADVIRNAGLANQKSKSIIGALTMIHERVGRYDLEDLRNMPMLEARKWLMDLPGVGPKTASIVLSFSLGQPAIPVDTHVYRVSWRLGVIGEVGENKAHDRLLSVVPSDLAHRYHSDLIQHGRMVCKAPLPLCDKCSVSDLCQWFKNRGPEKKLVEMAKTRKHLVKKK